MDRDDVRLAFPMQPFKDQRVEECVEGMYDARRDAVRELGAIDVRIAPSKAPDDSTVLAASADGHARAEDFNVMLARGDAIRSPADRIPLHLGAVEGRSSITSCRGGSAGVGALQN